MKEKKKIYIIFRNISNSSDISKLDKKVMN